MNELNTSVLIIDDEEMVRDNMEDILVPRAASQDKDNMNSALSVLFDTPQTLSISRTRNIPVFTVDKASNGIDGARKVREAVESGSPYAVIFLDMRMPGLSGLETAMEIRKYDCKAEIIFLTAYSDHSIEDIVDQAGQNVGYHCKPYAPEEILQLATKAVSDYEKLRNLENLIESISSIGLNNNHLNHLLKNILVQVAGSLKTDMALIGKLNDDFAYEKVLSIGDFEENINLDALIARVRNIKIEKGQLVQIDEFVLARMENYSVFAILKRQENLKTEKMYLLKLFMQNATQAIKNAELNEQLIQKEKLSAVGQVIGMVIHDLRAPINNIKQTISLMREEGEESELIGLIDQSAEKASDIFDDFLDFIKANPITKVPVSINKIVEEAIKQSRARSSIGQISITKDITETIFVPGDESKLERILTNLVNNAIDVLSDASVKNAGIHISANIIEKELILIVADNGPGIPPEISNTLFEPFITKHKKNGTGLGLAIVKQFITMHGGRIVVNNNNGAVFTINLPLK